MTRLTLFMLTLLFSLSGPAMGENSDFGRSSLAAKATPRAFWTGVDGELAAQASGAQVLKPSQAALDAATKGNWGSVCKS